MKQLNRLIAISMCVSVAFVSAASFSDSTSSKVTYSIAGTMSQSTAIKLSSTGTTVSDPYYEQQWALNNDGTFTPQVSTGTPDYNYNDPMLMPSPGREFNNPGWQNNARDRMKGDFKNFLGTYKTFSQTITTTAVADVDLDAPEAWEVAGDSGREVIVAVIDTGIDYTHEDLKDTIWTNSGEIAGDGIDNDNNGYIDDVYGWDFYNDKAIALTADSSEYEHGTHVAGIIAAAHNSTGISGIISNGKIKIMNLKVLGGSSGSGEADSVVSAIQYAEKMGASICNLSFGTEQSDSALKEAIEDSDMLFVCAAGNASNSYTGDNTDVNPVYPADYDFDNIISVANLTYDGTLDSTSDYGSTSVDIAAPGTYIISTLPNNTYGYMSGTSMAAPMVTAVAALVYSYHQDATLSEVRDIILSSAQSMTALQSKVATGGMLNAYNALTMKLTTSN